jgi:hypothetical protein
MLLQHTPSSPGSPIPTYSWDGRRWAQVCGGTTACTAVRSFMHKMATLHDQGRVALFGGIMPAEWALHEWDGSDWLLQSPVGASPSRRYLHAMSTSYAGDLGREVALLYGGFNITEGGRTWEWDSVEKRWTAHDPPPGETWPGDRQAHALAYDAARQRVVLHGGNTSAGLSGETWEWVCASRTWLHVSPGPGEPSPGPRQSHSMAFDASRGRVVLFGGAGNGGATLGDTWTWDGAAWRSVLPADPEADGKPRASGSISMGYDPGRQRVVLLDRGTSSAPDDTTWEWDGGAAERPSVVVRVNLPSALLVPGTALQQLAVDAHAGGSGLDSGGDVADGLELLIWRSFGFYPIASGQAPADAPALLSGPVPGQASSPDFLAEVLTSQPAQLSLALVPSGANGESIGEVSLDYIEVRVSYRRPPG